MQTDSAFKAPARVRKGPFAEMLNELNRDQSIHAQAEHDGSIAFGPSMRVERFVFGNGLRVLVLEDHTAPVICLQTWFGVGSRHEKDGKTGIAHLFEHLMFGETETTAHGAYDRMLEEAGAETNAATYLDWTFYHTNLPAEALELSLRLEANRMANLVLREPQVASEKEVVANERRQRVDDDVDGAVNEMLYKEAFREHGYRHPTIGWMEDILGFTTEDCVSFYKTYYSPNNATMVIVGDVKTGQVLKLLQEKYGHMAPAEIPVEDVHPEPPQVEERRLSTTKPTPTPKVAIGYKCPALGDFDHAPLLLLNEILFGGRSSRVHRELVIYAAGPRALLLQYAAREIWHLQASGDTDSTCSSPTEVRARRATHTAPSAASLSRPRARRAPSARRTASLTRTSESRCAPGAARRRDWSSARTSSPTSCSSRCRRTPRAVRARPPSSPTKSTSSHGL